MKIRKVGSEFHVWSVRGGKIDLPQALRYRLQNLARQVQVMHPECRKVGFGVDPLLLEKRTFRFNQALDAYQVRLSNRLAMKDRERELEAIFDTPNSNVTDLNFKTGSVLHPTAPIDISEIAVTFGWRGKFHEVIVTETRYDAQKPEIEYISGPQILVSDQTERVGKNLD